MLFILSDLQVLGAKKVILLFVRDYHAWTDGRRGAREGTVYGVLALPAGSEPSIVQVKVPGETSIIPQAVIDAYNTKKEFLEISFKDFQGRTYTDKQGRVALSCKASEATLETAEVEIDY